MDLSAVTSLILPQSRAAIPAFTSGDAFLAGGTWLFSEPQDRVRRLIDLCALPWPRLQTDPAGLSIPAATTLAALAAYEPPASWPAAAVIAQCCEALLGSFKISAIATIGGNLCLALPAAPMAAMAVALQGVCGIWCANGTDRVLPASLFILGAQKTALAQGEILRSVHLPACALARRAAFRQMSLTQLGRSAALLIGTTDAVDFDLTITAATPRPVRLAFSAAPSRAKLREAIDAAVPGWLEDVHGRPAWRRRITHLLAADICAELLG